MDTVVQLFPGGVVSLEQQEAMHELDREIAAAIDAAKSVGVPQALIVALLHGHAHTQTEMMMES